jgi:F420-dependent oxidoreductase-like protein
MDLIVLATLERMRLDVHYANFSHPDWQHTLVDRLTGTARIADEGDASMFTVMDHWFQMAGLGGPREPMLEGYTTLGHLAAVTSKVRLGLMVTGTTYRHPGLLAKIVTTLDVLSRGRAVLGIGAAWYEREHLGLGVPFPPTGERFERLEETLQICQQMWSSDNGAFEGRHYQLAETYCVPPPVQRPHPPILIGGSGERKTLRFVARYADASNLFAAGPDVVGRKLAVLRSHCEAEGTDYEAIDKTILDGGADPTEDPDGFLKEMGEYAALGVGLVSLIPRGDPERWMTRMCEDVVPRLREV